MASVSSDLLPLVIMSIIAIITIPLNALLLMFSTKFFKLKDNSYGTAFRVALVVGIIAAIPISYIITFIAITLVGLWLIKTKYKLGWNKAASVLSIWFVFILFLALVIGAIYGVIAIFITIFFR